MVIESKGKRSSQRPVSETSEEVGATKALPKPLQVYSRKKKEKKRILDHYYHQNHQLML